MGALAFIFGDLPSWQWMLPLVPGGEGDPFEPESCNPDACDAWAALGAELHGHNTDNARNKNWNVVWYDRIVPKTEQQKMTADVCFASCRTVPGANYFGLRAGRQCHCAPFFERYPGLMLEQRISLWV